MGLLEPLCGDSVGDFYCRFTDSAAAYEVCVYTGKVGDVISGIVGYNLRLAKDGTGPSLCEERGLGNPLALPAPLIVKAKRLIEARLAELNAMPETLDCTRTSDRSVECHGEAIMPTQPTDGNFTYDYGVVCDRPAANALCDVRAAS